MTNDVISSVSTVPIRFISFPFPRKQFNRDPVIVVDGSCCLRAIYEDSKLDWVCGGQYKEYYDKIQNFIEKFEGKYLVP